jgi:flagellar hook-associated protein 1 FlgK
MQTLLADVSSALHELNVNLAGIDSRSFFIGTVGAFLDKAHNIHDELFDFQRNLDGQIRNMVADINDIVGRIDRLSNEIRGQEMSGDNANDLRDERNRLLDRLSGLVPMEYFEDPRTGSIDIMTQGGNFLLSQGRQNFLGLKMTSGRYNLVEPVFTASREILPANTSPGAFTPFFNWNRPINAANNNDEGALMALLQARGSSSLTYLGHEAMFPPISPADLLAEFTANGVNAGNIENYWNNIISDNDRHNLEMLYPMLADAANRQSFMANDAALMGQMNSEFRAADRAYRIAQWDEQNATIPKLMMQMDQIVNSVVSLINDFLAPVVESDIPIWPFLFDEANPGLWAGGWPAGFTAADFDAADPDTWPIGTQRQLMAHPDPPKGLGDPPPMLTEVFVRRNNPGDRFDAAGNFNPGMQGDFNSLYTTRNLIINPLLLDPNNGPNLLALSLSGDPEDTRLINDLIHYWNWEDPDNPYNVTIDGNRFGIDRAYNVVVTNLAVEFREADNFFNTQFMQAAQADNSRKAISGVSMDEELSNMMTFQFAYQAAARLFNIVDSMIDTVVNRMLR